MKKIIQGILLTFALSLSVGALSACGGGTTLWRAQPVNAGGVIVEVMEVRVHGTRMSVRANVRNVGPSPITVIRDQMTLTLPNGQAISRNPGAYGGLTDVPYTIMPGGAHLLSLDYMGGGFRWRDIAQGQINLQGGILLNGAPIVVPPLMVAR